MIEGSIITLVSVITGYFMGRGFYKSRFNKAKKRMEELSEAVSDKALIIASLKNYVSKDDKRK
jgi:hypothetical protein